MRVKVSLKRSILIWLAGFIVGAILVFGCFYWLFFRNWDVVQPLIIGFYVLLMVTLLILSLFTNYYEITKKYVTIHKFGKEVVYYYSDIIYIDKEYSEKKKTILLVTRFDHVRYITFDKEGVLYNTMMEHCQNLISKEELLAKKPNIKI